MPTEEEIEAETRKLEKKHERGQFFSLGVRRKKYVSEQDFRDEAIRRLEKRKMRRMQR